MKLLATDYDGTLKYLDTITDEDLEALKKWKVAGHLLVIDTGRSMESILMEAKKYDLAFDYYITNNGGMLYDRNENVLFSSYLANDVSHEIMKRLKDMDGVVSYVVNDGYHRHRVLCDSSLEEKRYPSLLPDLSEEEVLSLNRYAQIVCSFDTRELAAKAESMFRKEYGDSLEAYANKYVVDLVPKGMSKATGITLVEKLEGISQEDVYTIGDGANDITMMEYGMNGYVMSNAKEEIRRHAKKEVRCISELIEQVL